MYSLEGVKKGLSHPRFILQEANRRLWYQRLGTWSYNRDGVNIFDEDWDNLFILDACRYDLFERTHSLPGSLSSVESRASATVEFLQSNFDGRELLDTVYVTASPMLYRHRDDVDVEFHAVVDIWKDRGWDKQYRTVLPETVRDEVLAAAERYPDKRLLVHFLQPHYPFLGPTGLEHFDLDRLDFQWEDAALGRLDIPDDVIRRAYEENLDQVLPVVEELLMALDGRTVVTADHGQMLGERLFPFPIREYGHPAGIYSEELVKVPWHVFDEGPRREVVAEAPESSAEKDYDEEMTRDRLSALGYIE